MQCIGLWLKEEPFQPKFDALHRILVERWLNLEPIQPKSDALHRILVEWVLNSTTFQPKFPKSDALHRILVEWVLNSTTFQPKFDAVHRILVERSFFSVDFVFWEKKDCFVMDNYWFKMAHLDIYCYDSLMNGWTLKSGQDSLTHHSKLLVVFP